MAASNEEVAVRSHDVLVTCGQTRAAEFDALTNIGAAVRLAVNLRGVPAVDFGLLRQVAVHRLGLQPAEVKPATLLLARAEMVDLDTQGTRVRTVVPKIPYYAELYTRLGEVGTVDGLNEHEDLTVALMSRLHTAPATQDGLAHLGAEKGALGRVVEIGREAGFIVCTRARGQHVYSSPGYFSEDAAALGDLAVLAGDSRLARVLGVLRAHQGYPLDRIRSSSRLGDVALGPADVALIEALAGEGFVPPPAIRTSHAGEHHFIFGPRPGQARLSPSEVQIYRNALAIVAAVRQGQFLARTYAVRSPRALLQALLTKRCIAANSEALEQYRGVVQAGVAVLEPTGASRARLRLVAEPDNVRAVEMALRLVGGDQLEPAPDSELILALRQGEQYVEPLLARKALTTCTIVQADPDARQAVDDFLLRRAQ